MIIIHQINCKTAGDIVFPAVLSFAEKTAAGGIVKEKKEKIEWKIHDRM